MTRNKIAAGILTAAAATAATAVTVFAAEPFRTVPMSQVAVPHSVTVTADESAGRISESRSERDGMQKFVLKTDENGEGYFVTENGEKIYFSVCVDANEAGITFTPSEK